MTKKKTLLRIRVTAWWNLKWVRLTAIGLAIPAVLVFFALGYYYVSFARLLDARLSGERSTVLPRVLARPLELRRGQSLTERQLVDRLNDLGYAQRTMFDKPGEFVIGSGDVTIMPRGAGIQGPVGAGGLSEADAAQHESSPAAAGEAGAAPRCRSGAGPRARHAADRTGDARRARPDRAHQRRAREAAAGGARRDSRAA